MVYVVWLAPIWDRHCRITNEAHGTEVAFVFRTTNDEVVDTACKHNVDNDVNEDDDDR